MSVAKSQIDELFLVVEKHVPGNRLREFLLELRLTQAYASNRSFRETVDLLIRRERGAL